MRRNLSIVCSLLLLAACSSPSDKANDLVLRFAEAAKAADSAAVVKVYPNASTFTADIPKMNDLQMTGTTETDTSVVVECKSSYYDENCVFVQNPLTFIVRKVQGNYTIVDSRGLLVVPDELKTFALKTGAVRTNSTDVEISQVREDLKDLFLQRYWLCSFRVKRGIEKVSWSWEENFGTPNGRCTIKNTLPFTVKDVKYKITYYRGNDSVGSDEGTAADELESGALKSFTFFSSGVNGYSAQTARIEFEVPDKYIVEWVVNDTYQGNEFAKYVHSKQRPS
jgi:hypothetical protein